MLKINQIKSIKNFCLWCCDELENEVKLCPSVKCPLWKFRKGRNPNDGSFAPTQIELKCSDCQEDKTEVIKCSFKDCPLYPYRLNK